MSVRDELQATIADMVQRGKGILAADESTPTITKRFQAVGIASNEETRRIYRQLLLSTPGLGEFISGVILYEETLGQKADDGTPLPELARSQGIVPGIKVDKGLTGLANAPGEKVTQGLDGLAERLAGYKAQGARFAKWRAVYAVGPDLPGRLAVQTNAEVLARYAAICHEVGIVPIVEPEVLIDGDHGIEQSETVTEAVQDEVFLALKRHRVQLEYIILKPSMVIPGKAHPVKADPVEVAERTVRILRRTVPAAVSSINFLSGGQTPQEATARLNAMNAGYPHLPWLLSFSYARALQEPPMALWKGEATNAAAAQAAFLHRAKLNSLAQKGTYDVGMEQAR
ncbi:class I fructose-bisphosphate aldolase [Methylococcus sp. EFPC2]|uniref:class I fructose-bisphosphate aldolase n=1 Tax=Methylococcus sp. EFPC2 TaxID=2812648 RepID=UPI0019671FB6|nr:class I fructose-bisphosphate aldolase [Methylococcus sp. EFPC2]QSA98588.1 fructose-bisphosphate aldolase class I [Methylococcus sp. EFPC2]